MEDRLKKYELPERPNIFWPLLAFVAAFVTAALYSLSAWVAAGIAAVVFVIVLLGTSLKGTLDRRLRCPVCRAVVAADAERCLNCGNDLGEGRRS